MDLLCGGLGWPLPIVAPVLAGAGIVLVYRDLAGCERDLKRGELQRLDDPKRKMSVLVRVTYVLAVGGVATQIMLKKMLGINGLIVLAYFVWVWLYIIDVKTAFQLFYKYRLRRKYDLPLLRPAEAAQVELKVQS
ncbi:hypothetical protein [Azotosporobacter soli]|uniref:hypothetical protein n=1 Tax=Azotosporobacter soli TaxID=3055040 RepID=UPI0031FE5986